MDQQIDPALLAKMLMQNRERDPYAAQRQGLNMLSADTSPVQSTEQGLARALQSGLRGLMAGNRYGSGRELQMTEFGSGTQW